jgi:hypothetical protein
MVVPELLVQLPEQLPHTQAVEAEAVTLQVAQAVQVAEVTVKVEILQDKQPPELQIPVAVVVVQADMKLHYQVELVVQV